MKRIKVYIVQPTIPLYRLGLFAALARCEKLQIEVHASKHVVGGAPSIESVPDWGSVTHHCHDFLGGRLFWQMGLRLPRDFGPGDVLVINGNPRFLSGIYLAIRARLRGVGVVWWGHGWSPTSVRWRASIRHQLMRIAHVILLYTDQEAEGVAPKFDRNVLGLNNTLDMQPILNAAACWPASRLLTFAKEFNLEGRKILLFCGRLRSDPSTDLDVAIRALAILREQQQVHVLVVIGEGPQEASLKALAKSLNVQDLIWWRGAIYEEEALAPWFMSATCVVFPGPIGLTLMHALAYGVPVVTHSGRQAHGPEIAALKPNENGLVFSRGNAEDLARQIARITSDSEFRQRLSLAARITMEKDFSFQEMVRRFEFAIELAARGAHDDHAPWR